MLLELKRFNIPPGHKVFLEDVSWQQAKTGKTPQISQLREGIHKNYVLDDNQQPIAVQISIAEFERIEEIIEDFGLARLMEEAEDEDNERLSKDEALKYYQTLKGVSKSLGGDTLTPV